MAVEFERMVREYLRQRRFLEAKVVAKKANSSRLSIDERAVVKW